MTSYFESTASQSTGRAWSSTDPQEGVVCMVLDFVYDSELEMHVVQVLMEGRVLYLLRSDLRPVSV